jgi:hypothetical protein
VSSVNPVGGRSTPTVVANPYAVGNREITDRSYELANDKTAFCFYFSAPGLNNQKS